MSRTSEYHHDLETIRAIIGDDEPGSPEQMFGERIHRMVDEMIDLTVLAADPAQSTLFQAESRGIAQILLRSQFILSALNGEDVEQLRRVIAAIDYAKQPQPVVVSFRR